MERTIDDNVKQKLLDSLSKEPTMVISTAYAYAKNYVDHGEDITKAWTTAVQHASIIEKVENKARTEAYDSFKKEYENRLKADLKAILVELQLEIEELKPNNPNFKGYYEQKVALNKVSDIIQQKIDKLKGEEKC